MVACDEGSLAAPPSAALHTLQQCKAACDANARCKSFSYSGSLQRCSLRSVAGEPPRFCSRDDLATYWRVDIPGRRRAPPPPPQSQSVAVVPASPRRVLVQGRRLIDSLSGTELQLHGINVYLDYLRFDDTALMRQLLPSANLVRLVGVFWHDGRDASQCACCTDDEVYAARSDT